MNLIEFIIKYNGVGGIGTTKENTGQCVGLVIKWLVSTLKQPMIWGHAKDLLVNADTNVYDIIKNTPEAIPNPGDVIVWTAGFNGTYGHTAIVVKGNVKTFEVFEQNNPLLSPCMLRTYPNYAYVDGWLRPKPNISNPVVSQTPSNPTISDQTLLDIGNGEMQEWQAIKSIIHDLRRDNAQLRQDLADAHSSPKNPNISDDMNTTGSDSDMITTFLEWFIEKVKKFFR